MKILAIVVEADTVRPCLDAAAAAATVDRSAAIQALHVDVDPDRIVAATEEIQMQRLRELRVGDANERAAATHAAFVAWNAGADPDAPQVRWTNVVGTEEEVLVSEADGADLIVLAHAADVDSTDAWHAAIHKTGKPVLLVPTEWSGRSAFEHVAVALSDTPVTDDAIEGAMPWLRAARRVTAIRVGDEEQALTLADRLSERGVSTRLHVAAPDGRDLGGQIVGEAEALGADLLVAGAYRRSRLVEWLVGGTTRNLLSAARIPLMLAH